MEPKSTCERAAVPTSALEDLEFGRHEITGSRAGAIDWGFWCVNGRIGVGVYFNSLGTAQNTTERVSICYFDINEPAPAPNDEVGECYSCLADVVVVVDEVLCP